MKLKHTPNSICDISEEDLWSSFKVGKNETGSALAQAVELGLAGKKARAYAKLAEYFTQTLSEEWQCRREEMMGKLGPHSAGQDPEDLLRNMINVWHTTVVDFGSEIDWDYNHTDKYGFHYLFWLQSGTRRLMEKGEKNYYQYLGNLVRSYYEARNRLYHPQERIHLVYYELGSWAKLVQLLPLYLELINTGKLPAATHEAFIKLFLGFGRSLHRLQKRYRGGNWQIVGCSALLTLGLVFPFKESSSWKKRGLKYLVEHLKRDYFADGCHGERSWSYGVMSLDGITSAWEVAQRYGGLGRDGAAFIRQIRKAYRWFAKTLGPGERKPAYGDCELNSGSGIIDSALKFFPAGTRRDLGIDRGASYYFKSSGFAFMRNGGGEKDAYLNMSLGPWAGWHSHMDLFNLNFWAEGEPLIEEVGRFGGYGEGLAIVFRAPESHNQVTVDAMHYDVLDQKNRTAREVVWHSTPEADFLTAWHTAYRGQPLEPQSLNLITRRTVVFVKDPGYALVFDSVREEGRSSGEGPYFSLTQNWHSPFPFKQLSPATARTKGKSAMLIAFAREDNLRRLECRADFAGDEATGPSEFPERHYLRARRWMDVEFRGACGFATLLFPFKGKMPEVSIKTLPLKGAEPYRADAFQITTPRGKDVIVLNPEMMSGITFQGQKVNDRALLKLGNGRGVVLE